MIIVPENTAITNGVAKSAVSVTKEIPTDSCVLDYGAGKLRNANYLLEQGYRVSILETPLQLERLSQSDLSRFSNIYTINEKIEETFDAVLCSFVLNVVPNPEDRSKILQETHNLLKKEGKLFVEVRKSRGILNNKYKWEYGDGYAVGKQTLKTFQKPYEKAEFIEYVTLHGFMVMSIHSTSDGWMIVAVKQSN